MRRRDKTPASPGTSPQAPACVHTWCTAPSFSAALVALSTAADSTARLCCSCSSVSLQPALAQDRPSLCGRTGWSCWSWHWELCKPLWGWTIPAHASPLPWCPPTSRAARHCPSSSWMFSSAASLARFSTCTRCCKVNTSQRKARARWAKAACRGGEGTGGTRGWKGSHQDHVPLSPRHRQTSQRATKRGSAQDNYSIINCIAPAPVRLLRAGDESLEMPPRGATSPRQPITHGNLEPSWQEHAPGRRQPSLRVPAEPDSALALAGKLFLLARLLLPPRLRALFSSCRALCGIAGHAGDGLGEMQPPPNARSISGKGFVGWLPGDCGA